MFYEKDIKIESESVLENIDVYKSIEKGTVEYQERSLDLLSHRIYEYQCRFFYNIGALLSFSVGMSLLYSTHRFVLISLSFFAAAGCSVKAYSAFGNKRSIPLLYNHYQYTKLLSTEILGDLENSLELDVKHENNNENQTQKSPLQIKEEKIISLLKSEDSLDKSKLLKIQIQGLKCFIAAKASLLEKAQNMGEKKLRIYSYDDLLLIGLSQDKMRAKGTVQDKLFLSHRSPLFLIASLVFLTVTLGLGLRNKSITPGLILAACLSVLCLYKGRKDSKLSLSLEEKKKEIDRADNHFTQAIDILNESKIGGKNIFDQSISFSIKNVKKKSNPVLQHRFWHYSAACVAAVTLGIFSYMQLREAAIVLTTVSISGFCARGSYKNFFERRRVIYLEKAMQSSNDDDQKSSVFFEYKANTNFELEKAERRERLRPFYITMLLVSASGIVLSLAKTNRMSLVLLSFFSTSFFSFEIYRSQQAKKQIESLRSHRNYAKDMINQICGKEEEEGEKNQDFSSFPVRKAKLQIDFYEQKRFDIKVLSYDECLLKPLIQERVLLNRRLESAKSESGKEIKFFFVTATLILALVTLYFACRRRRFDFETSLLTLLTALSAQQTWKSFSAQKRLKDVKGEMSQLSSVNYEDLLIRSER